MQQGSDVLGAGRKSSLLGCSSRSVDLAHIRHYFVEEHLWLGWVHDARLIPEEPVELVELRSRYEARTVLGLVDHLYPVYPELYVDEAVCLTRDGVGGSLDDGVNESPEGGTTE
jgi:hypothetical protein